MSQAALIGVDWGTSNLRACLFGEDGAVLEWRGSDQGILRVEAGGHQATLSRLIEGWAPDGSQPRILMCGMIGSRQGWREAAYAHCPAGLPEIAGSLARVETTWADTWIVPGVSVLAADDTADVMRGEETQVLGVIPDDGEALVIAPGTHSKWANAQAGRMTGFRTYLTGELYDLLSRHSILARLMEGDTADGACFALGAERALAAPGLLGLLFSTRSEALFDHLPATGLASYLSGLLIGSEVAEGLKVANPRVPVIVVASPRLGELYGAVLEMAGRPATGVVDGGEASARGLWRIWEAMA